MKIVVTGGAGFIGSHLVDRLCAQTEHEVLIFDNLRSAAIASIECHLKTGRARFIQGDLRDKEAVEEALDGAELVYHLGAQSNVMGAVQDTDYCFSTNVIGTYHVLKAAHTQHVRRLIFTSSREVYGEPQSLPVSEEHPLNAKNPYGASKIAGEAYCRVFGDLFGLQTVILRLSNVYGPRDNGRVITRWLQQAAHHENLLLYGGEQTIDFIWIDTVIDALQRSATANIAGIPTNIGSGQGVTLKALASRIQKLLPGPYQIKILPARQAEVTHYIAKIEQMRRLLDIQPPPDALFGLPKMVAALRQTQTV